MLEDRPTKREHGGARMQMPYGTKHSTNVKIRKKPARDDMSCWTSVRMSALAHFSPCDSHMLFTFWLASKTDTQTKSRTRSKDRQKSLISSQCCEAWNHSCSLVLDEVSIGIFSGAFSGTTTANGCRSTAVSLDLSQRLQAPASVFWSNYEKMLWKRWSPKNMQKLGSKP
jgi:hypothetical protein